MRLLYVVQRYGVSIAGGAEQHCREMAERMARRGHTVEIATTCAESYVDWANALEPGRSEEGGVVVHRFEVAQPRDNELFTVLNRRVVEGRDARPLPLQREWLRMQGPYSPRLVEWLERNARRFDCVICFTYLYWTTVVALDRLAGTVPLVFHPTVHDEPALRLSLFDAAFRCPDAFALSTPEEIELIQRRFHVTPPGAVIGIGVEVGTADPQQFRAAYGLGAAPYLLYVGRIDPGKGAGELVEFFVEYKRRQPNDDVRLVMLGDALMGMPERDDLVVTGFVDYATRDNALAGALALAQPSFFESFSMALTEAFAHGRPALVRASNEVLRGHAMRSNAAIPYSGFAEFECALELFRDDPALADAMGAAGRAYVDREYRWDTVLDRYEQLLERTIATASVAL